MRGCKQVMQKVNLGSLVLPTNGYNKQKQSVPRLSPNLSFITEVKEEPGNEAKATNDRDNKYKPVTQQLCVQVQQKHSMAHISHSSPSHRDPFHLHDLHLQGLWKSIAARQ